MKKFRVNNFVIFLVSITLFTLGTIYSYHVQNIFLYDVLLLRILNILSKVFGNTGRLIQAMFYIVLGMLIYKKIHF